MGSAYSHYTPARNNLPHYSQKLTFGGCGPTLSNFENKEVKTVNLKLVALVVVGVRNWSMHLTMGQCS